MPVELADAGPGMRASALLTLGSSGGSRISCSDQASIFVIGQRGRATRTGNADGQRRRPEDSCEGQRMVVLRLAEAKSLQTFSFYRLSTDCPDDVAFLAIQGRV